MKEDDTIAASYGTRTTKHSGVPLMQHIDEGLVLLDRIERLGVTDDAREELFSALATRS